MYNIYCPDVSAASHYLVEDGLDLELGDCFAQLQQLAQITSVAEVEDHIQMVGRLD